MLAEGATTKEAAAALFLSPKTVEYHLRHIYQKLGIRFRGELSAAKARPVRRRASARYSGVNHSADSGGSTITAEAGRPWHGSSTASTAPKLPTPAPL